MQARSIFGRARTNSIGLSIVSTKQDAITLVQNFVSKDVNNAVKTSNFLYKNYYFMTPTDFNCNSVWYIFGASDIISFWEREKERTLLDFLMWKASIKSRSLSRLDCLSCKHYLRTQVVHTIGFYTSCSDFCQKLLQKSSKVP